MNGDIEDLKHGGFWYVATVYSKHASGLDDAWQEACLLTGSLIKRGLSVYSPIAMCHPIALMSKIDPTSHELWLNANKPIFQASCGLLVLAMPGWRESYGIGQELEWAAAHKKPRFLVDPVALTWQAMP